MPLKKIESKPNIKDGCCDSEMSDRRNKITEILIASKYPSANEFNGSVDSLARSNLSVEEIESLVRSMTSEYNNANSIVNRRAGVF